MSSGERAASGGVASATAGEQAVVVLAAVIALGAAVRIALLRTPGYGFDVATMSGWARVLATRPLGEFYASSGLVDHLPGDLWILAGLARVFAWAGGTVAPGSARLAAFMKLVPFACDLVAGLQVFVIVRGLRDERTAVIASAAYVLNPALIFVGAVWGQWDGVSLLVVLIAVRLAMAGRPAFALPVITYAALIKPQYGLIAIAMAAWFLARAWREVRATRGEQRRTLLRRYLVFAAVAVIASYVVLVGVLLPFGIAVPPFHARWSLLERLRYAADAWPYVSMYAFNVWTISEGAHHQVVTHDSVAMLWSSARVWGIAATALISLGTIGVLVVRRSRGILAWALTVLPYALFVFATRQHERYELPVIALGVVLASMQAQLWWWYAGVSAVIAINLVFAFAVANPLPGGSMIADARALPAIASAANVALFFVLIAAAFVWREGLRRPRGEGDHAGESSEDFDRPG